MVLVRAFVGHSGYTSMHLMDTDWILLAALRGWPFCVSI